MAGINRRNFLLASCSTGVVLSFTKLTYGMSVYTPPAPNLIEPADLAALLNDDTKRPHIFCVGFSDSYQRQHIPHAQFAGTASQPAGIKTLRATVKPLSKDTPIVVYCGCCPIKICPNVHPAYKLLQSLKFKNVRMLNLPKDFHTDWEGKGYPTV